METAETLKPTLRRRIIDAADALIREHGIAGATTREIARRAECAEGSIYVHFEDKIDLVIAVIVERDPLFAHVLELPAKAGEATVEANLVPWAQELLRLLRENQPIFFALMGDRNVFTRFKERLRERQTGPIAVFQAAAAYVEAEQALGRVDAGLEPQVVASILIGACRDRTLTRTLADLAAEPDSTFAEQLVQTLVFGLAPGPAARPAILEEEPS